jgi:hypothetical protein
MAISTFSSNAIQHCETQVGILTDINTTTSTQSIPAFSTTRDNFKHPAEKIEDSIKTDVALINTKKAQILQIGQTANQLGCGSGTTTDNSYTGGRFRIREDELATFKFDDIDDANVDNLYADTSIVLNASSGIGVTTYLFVGKFQNSGIETGTTFGSDYAFTKGVDTDQGGISHSAVTNLGHYYGKDLATHTGINSVTGVAGTTTVVYETIASAPFALQGNNTYCAACLSSITTLANEIIVLRQGLLQNPDKLEGLSKIKDVKTDFEIAIHASNRNIARNNAEKQRLNTAKEVMQLDEYDGII